MTASFKGSTIVLESLCDLPDGTTGKEILEGQYAATESAIAITLKRASCPAEILNLDLAFTYLFDDEVLVVDTGGKVVSLTRMKSGVAADAIGCFDGDFTAMPLAPL